MGIRQGLYLYRIKRSYMTKKEFVSMSLPYGLKVVIPESNTKGCRKTVVGTVGVVFDDGSINCYDTVNACPKWYRPILHPLSDADKITKSNVPIILTLKYRKIDFRSTEEIELITLVKLHFDVAGLIAKGQAIDVNSLKVNPYKKK